MGNTKPDVIVAGHICLDIIPGLRRSESGAPELPQPGRLAEVGPAVTSTGGCVSNTGFALHRLGIAVKLMGKVGDDLLGRATVDSVRQQSEGLSEGMIIARGESSSYTVVINPPDVDRSFMHFPGPNDSFVADDVDYAAVSKARLFHFGYPPLMRSMFEGDGRELETLLRQVKKAGVATSLDMAQPDPQSRAGTADWRAILARVLPHVDLFLPSLDEVLYMLDRERFERAEAQDTGGTPDYSLCAELAETLLAMGAAVVCLKLGAHGLYLRSTTDIERIEGMGRGGPGKAADWVARELAAPCFRVEVAGATGSGDCTVAGFLASWLRGLAPPQAMNTAVAVGACNVEHVDATSGVRTWEETVARIEGGWTRHEAPIAQTGWRWDESRRVLVGPKDDPI